MDASMHVCWTQELDLVSQMIRNSYCDRNVNPSSYFCRCGVELAKYEQYFHSDQKF